MILLSRHHRENYIRVVVLAFVIIAPSLLMAEDRPGFYNPDFRSFELTKYNVSFNSSVSNTISTNNSTGLRCIGSECTTTQNTYSNDMDQYSFGVSFITPHVDRMSFGSFVNYTDQSASTSQETSDGLNTNYDSNHAASLRVTGSYLLSDVSTFTASISQHRSSSANQTIRNVSFDGASRITDNVMLSGHISALWGDKLLPNGIKHIGGLLHYTRSLDQVDLNGFFNLARTTTSSRSQVSGIPTAREDRYNKMGSGGSIHIKHDASKFGVIGNFNVSDRAGSPRDVSFGPQYIFTAPDFEISLTGNYKVSRLNNITKPNHVVNYSDNVTKELSFRYVREIQDGYFLDSSLLKSWNSNGSNIIGSEAQSESDAELWSLNFGVSRLF